MMLREKRSDRNNREGELDGECKFGLIATAAWLVSGFAGSSYRIASPLSLQYTT